MSELICVQAPETGNRKADIIFIHGLDGNAESTWDSGAKNGDYWPSWLGAELPCCGIWLLDYDSASLRWKGSGMPLFSRAANCLELLEVHEIGARPIVFITHSLGGLLAKQLIRYAVDSNRASIPTSTKGLVFLATPHTGSGVATWIDRLGAYLPLRPNDILKNLRDNDAALVDLNRWYRNHAENLDIQTKSYYEESKIAGMVTVVDRVSADPGIPGADPIPLDADHITICKPHSPKDLVYLSVSRFIDSCFALPTKHTDEVADKPDSSILFSMPEFRNCIKRPDLTAQLQLHIECNSLVSVGGISGSGKTYLVADSMQTVVRSGIRSNVFWHDPMPGESLENLLLTFAQTMTFQAHSTIGKCKAALAYLTGMNSILVVDNFETVDSDSYSVLVQAAIAWPGCARLIIVSKQFVDNVAYGTGAVHMPVPGFDLKLARQYLEERGLEKLGEERCVELLAKTGGLPLALSLFSVLVKEFGRKPKNLLRGEFEQTRRVRQWFDDVLDSTGGNSRLLLQRLSMCDRPFNLGVVKTLSADLPSRNGLDSFEKLQKSYLIQNYSTYRWKVHDLIGVLTSDGLDVEVAAYAHLRLGKYFERKLTRKKGPDLSYENRIWKVRALRHYLRLQSTEGFRNTDRILNQIAPSIKKAGLYSLYAELTRKALDSDRVHDRWIEYHYAHCCLIVGRISDGMGVAEALVHSNETPGPLRIASARLYAELMHESGSTEEAAATLESVLEAVPPDRQTKLVRQHAESVLGSLWVELGEFDVAQKLLQRILKEAEDAEDIRGTAIALARMSELSIRQHSTSFAVSLAELALTLFREDGDQRGTSWVLGILAELKLLEGDHEEAVSSIKGCIRIRKDSDEKGRDYNARLQRMLAIADSLALKKLLTKEIKRVSNFTSL